MAMIINIHSVLLRTIVTSYIQRVFLSSENDMSFLESDVSVSLTSIFMKLVGLWMAADQYEQRLRNISVTYNLVAILFALYLQTTDIYYSWGNFSVSLLEFKNFYKTRKIIQI